MTTHGDICFFGGMKVYENHGMLTLGLLISCLFMGVFWFAKSMHVHKVKRIVLNHVAFVA